MSSANARIINVCTPDWTPAESYGRVARELTAGFQSLGYHVNTLGYQAPVRMIQPSVGGILLAYPTNHHQWGPLPQAGHKIAVTMFESTVVPPGWADALNQCDAVVVPSTWLVDVFRNAGVVRPIHVIPLGVTKVFHYRERPVDRQPFTFLCIGDRGKRKGWHIAGFAHQRVFGDDPNYQLIIKTRPDALPLTIRNPNISILEEEMTDKDLADLYARTDCMVFPTAGEGFGLPPREYAATGGPVMATAWGGTADDIGRWGIPLTDYALVPAWEHTPSLEGLGMWAEPSVDQVATWMRYVVEHREWALERGRQASQFVRKTYSWRSFAERVEALWREITDGH